MTRRAERKPNDLLRAARLARLSPSGSGRRMSRQEVAEGVAARLFATSGLVMNINADYVAKLERGESRWPGAAYRTAFRAFFEVDRDADLGFYITRPQPSAADVTATVEPAPDVSAARIDAVRIDLGRQLAALREAAWLTQTDLAGRLSCARTTIATIETGRVGASRQFWERADQELNAGGVLVKAFDELDDLLNERRRQRGEIRRRQLLAAPGASRVHGVAVGAWGWGEVRALRESLRLTVRAFAAHIGVSVATVCHWEHRERVTRLHLATEEMLDRALKIADDDARARFLELRDYHQVRRDGLDEER